MSSIKDVFAVVFCVCMGVLVLRESLEMELSYGCVLLHTSVEEITKPPFKPNPNYANTYFKNPEKNILKEKKNNQTRTPGVSTSHMM